MFVKYGNTEGSGWVRVVFTVCWRKCPQNWVEGGWGGRVIRERAGPDLFFQEPWQWTETGGYWGRTKIKVIANLGYCSL